VPTFQFPAFFTIPDAIIFTVTLTRWLQLERQALNHDTQKVQTADL
jgi:hypothetical protein